MAAAQSLLSQALPLLGHSPGKMGGMAAWLDSGSFVPSSDSDGSLILAVDDYANVLPFLSAEYERFALAAAQTFSLSLRQVEGALPQSAWRLLKIYYGAFFSAHAILRSVGIVDSHLNSKTVNKLNDLADIYGLQTDRIGTGAASIEIEFSASGSAINLRFLRSLPGNGVHDVFWRNFCSSLNRLAARAVGQGHPGGAELISEVDRICSLIRIGDENSGSWLSKIRNEINYQHAHDAWFPQSKGSQSRKAEADIRFQNSEMFRLDYSKSKEATLAFGSTCNYLCAMNWQIADSVASRSTRGGAFGQRWRNLLQLAGNLA